MASGDDLATPMLDVDGSLDVAIQTLGQLLRDTRNALPTATPRANQSWTQKATQTRRGDKWQGTNDLIKAILRIGNERLTKTGIQFLLISFNGHRRILKIQRAWASRPGFLGNLQTACDTKLRGLPMPAETVRVLKAAVADGGIIHKDSSEFWKGVLPSASSEQLDLTVQALGSTGKLIMVPLSVDEALLGVLVAWSPKTSRDDILSILVLANQIVFAVESAMLLSELVNKERQIKPLLRSILDAQEAERERISLEVHDGVAQTLASAFQYVQALESNSQFQTAQTKHLTNRIGALVKQAIRESREVVNSLRPATLERLGLVATLRQEIRELQSENGWKIDFVADSFRLDKEVETALYRIIREALQNVRKHAKTDHVRVELRQSDKDVMVQIRDWGIGFNAEQYHSVATHRTAGITSMQRRTELLGGEYQIDSNPGRGTTVTVWLPTEGGSRTWHQSES